MPRRLILNLRCQDAPAAIALLRRALGIAEHAVFPDQSDSTVIGHAELTWGEQMVMLFSVLPTPFATSAPLRTARQAGDNTWTT